MSTTHETELNILFPERTVEIAGTEFTIKPFSFGDTLKVITKFKKLAGILDSASFGSVESIVSIIITGEGELFDLLKMVYGKDRAWFERLDNANALKAIRSAVEVNYDFFTQNVAPMFEDLLRKKTTTQE